MIDRAAATRRTVTFDLPAGPLHVATPPFDIAADAGATVWFCAARADADYTITLA